MLPFRRDTLLISVHDCLRHRPGSAAEASALTDTIITKLLKRRTARSSRIDVSEVIDTVHDTLKRFDSLAAATYQAYHQSVSGR
jgi:transcriptional regulator NrdR family protein